MTRVNPHPGVAPSRLFLRDLAILLVARAIKMKGHRGYVSSCLADGAGLKVPKPVVLAVEHLQPIAWRFQDQSVLPASLPENPEPADTCGGVEARVDAFGLRVRQNYQVGFIGAAQVNSRGDEPGTQLLARR